MDNHCLTPRWLFCVSYELEIRKEAIGLCKEESYGIQSALWATLKNTEHRMKHWLQLVAIPNAPASSSNQEMQTLKKRIADLEKARSRSPRRNSQKQSAFAAGPAMLSLPAPAAPAQGSKGGRGRNNRKKAKGARKSAGSSQLSDDKGFQYLMKLPLAFRHNFHERFYKREICFSFQKNNCYYRAQMVRNEDSRISAWAAEAPSHNDECRCLTSTKSPEPLHYNLLSKPTEVTPLSAVPPVFPLVKSKIEPKARAPVRV